MQPKLMTPENEFAALIGIDWADKKHDIWAYDCQTRGRVYHQIENRPETIDDWIGQLQQAYPHGQLAICLEHSRGMLIYKLMSYDFITLYPVNPAMTAKYREAFACSGAKDDPGDADVMMELLIYHRDRLRPWRPEDAHTRQLSRLCEERRNAVDLRTKLVQQLGAKLKSYFPQALSLAGNDLTANMACDLLVKWPSLAQFKRAKDDTIRRFYYAHNSRSETRIKERLSIHKNAVPATEDPAIIAPLSQVAVMLAKLVRQLNASIRQFEREIAQLFATHTDAAIFSSFPNSGPALAPRLLTAFGTDRSRFTAAVEVQNLYGIAPVTEQSGKQRWVHRRWRCPKFHLQTFHEYAKQSLGASVWAQAYYQIQKQKGKKYHAIVRSLAYKWIRIMYACWQQSIPYDESKYIETLKKRKSPIAEFIEKQKLAA